MPAPTHFLKKVGLLRIELDGILVWSGQITAPVSQPGKTSWIKGQGRYQDIGGNCEGEMTAMTSALGARKRILFVDDDEETREMMNALLGIYGYEPVIASSVDDALGHAMGGGIDLCILDHWMTEYNGIDLCNKIRAFDSRTPIMFYSGAGYEADIQKGLDAGAQAYLVKPDIEHLKPTIDRLIDDAVDQYSSNNVSFSL
jgi:CheY-like chemotaxis protein